MDVSLGLPPLRFYALVLLPRVPGVWIGTVRALCGAGFGWLVAGSIGQASLLHT
ncbi:hypothetical protein [Amycolatopsis sp. NPDC021455]|uniref:hypothetical protein n=1 Tax=Amycolatopsis sp. NPDC021455 TaxID=3154901 RepID=UPI00340497C3